MIVPDRLRGAQGPYRLPAVLRDTECAPVKPRSAGRIGLRTPALSHAELDAMLATLLWSWTRSVLQPSDR